MSVFCLEVQIEESVDPCEAVGHGDAIGGGVLLVLSAPRASAISPHARAARALVAEAEDEELFL
jgi:hypothetical protein